MSEGHYPAIPHPDQDALSMHRTVLALKMAVELLTGTRGNNRLRVQTASEAMALRTTKLLAFTVNSLPAAYTLAHHLAFVSDGADNRRVVVSDGVVWRYMDGTTV